MQRLLTEAADAIQRGEHDAVALCGAEAAHSVALARKAGFALPWTPDTPTAEDAPPSPRHPAEDPEFVICHVDGIEAMGFCSHYKLPHYVTFQSDLENIRSSAAKLKGT